MYNWLRIVQSLVLLPLGTDINRVPLSVLTHEVVTRALEDSRILKASRIIY